MPSIPLWASEARFLFHWPSCLVAGVRYLHNSPLGAVVHNDLKIENLLARRVRGRKGWHWQADWGGQSGRGLGA